VTTTIAGSSLNETSRSDPGMIPEGFVYRDQSKRYPWWVKSVDKITTEVDESIMEKPGPTVITWFMRQPFEEIGKIMGKGRINYTEKIKNSEPGSRLQDVALHQAASSFWWAGGRLSGQQANASIFQLTKMAREAMSVKPSDFEAEPWQGSPAEASKMVETAGIFLGASQISYTHVNEKLLPQNIIFDDHADEVTRTEDGGQIFPSRFRYVITGAALVPVPAGMRTPSALGNAADRLGFEHAWLSMTRLIVFLTSIGYGAKPIPSMNPIPWAVASGLGEMGRMNRLISPLYGGALRLFSIITDLPLALDKPIDFGLQEFCRVCKKCAESCPAGALSMEKEPSWEWEGEQPWHASGKKVWWEDSKKCITQQMSQRCVNCMMACPWTKQDKTALHKLAHAVGARLPRVGGMLRKMDDLFGYGLMSKDNPRMNDWWDYDIPISGIDSNRSRR